MSTGIKNFSRISPSDYSGRFLQLNEFISKRHFELLDKSDAARAEVKSIDDLKVYSEFMRKNFIEKLGGIPESGDRFKYENIVVEILGTDSKKIESLLVTISEEEEE